MKKEKEFGVHFDQVNEMLYCVKAKTAKGAFWVRGHFMHFHSREKFVCIYKMTDEELKKAGYQKDANGLISIWKRPFIKAKNKGKLLNKEYKLKEEKK